ncbi:hypothetical protein E3G54_002963 [Mycobacteroides abscessus]|nr:hypothetical protein [Mycobacteroides abscessus]
MRPDCPGFFAELMYAVNAAPWDIGGPQPVIRQLAALGAVRGEVLDPGCGTGWHAVAVARGGEGQRNAALDPGSAG